MQKPNNRTISINGIEIQYTAFQRSYNIIMSDAYKSIKSRYLSSDEKRLLSALLLKAGITKTVSWIDSISIFPFDDGGMGSYYFLECHSIQVASDILFLDSDGVYVLATLYVNNNYEPCEVDMWKMDYSSLKQIPQVIIDVRSKSIR